eukprot:11207539-Lingulodinium_polyedra.AAC.1
MAWPATDLVDSHPRHHQVLAPSSAKLEVVVVVPSVAFADHQRPPARGQGPNGPQVSEGRPWQLLLRHEAIDGVASTDQPVLLAGLLDAEDAADDLSTLVLRN